MAIGLIIETDVAADYGETEGRTRVPHPVDCLLELPHHVGFFGIAEIQAVGQGHRPGAAHGHVARPLGDRGRGAAVRVEQTGAVVAVHADGDAFGRLLEPDDRGVRTGLYDRVPAHQKIVLPIDPLLARTIHGREQAQQDVAEILRHGQRRGIQPLAVVEGCGARRRAFVGRRLRREGLDRNADDVLPAPAGPKQAVVRHVADLRGLQVPLGEHLGDRGLAALPGHDQHAFLRFGQQQFVCGHPVFAGRHAVQVEEDAGVSAVGHFDRGTRQSGRAHVLDADDQILLHQFQTGFDQEVLGERVPDLHRGAEILGPLVELPRGQQAGAVDAVAAGARADVDDRVAGAGRGGPEDAVRPHDAQRERVDQNVAVVAGMERDLAADGRHADAVAVAADAGHHALDQKRGPRVIDGAEAQRVQRRDRPGAHREHVAQNPADAGRRTVIGLDERRVVVTLDLEDRGQPVADFDDAGVLARTLKYVRAGGRQAAEKAARALVAAMLRPHDREHAEFFERGHAVQRLHDARVLLCGQAVREGRVQIHAGHEFRPRPT